MTFDTDYPDDDVDDDDGCPECGAGFDQEHSADCSSCEEDDEDDDDR